jgi:anaerobic ribonucleoside-triphosphate reductase
MENVMNDLSSHAHLRDNEIFLTEEERQPCEVWTRVMGYHRPVASFNIGKKGEHYERKHFQECRIALTA